jgi:hypothetical protein
VEVEATVLEPDEDPEEPLGDTVARRKAPLAVSGRTGPEEFAVGAEKHRRKGVLEADDRNCQPNQEGKGDAKA